VLGDGLLRSVVIGGSFIAAVVLAAGAVAHHADRPWQSVVFVVLGLAQLGVALAVRARADAGTARNWSLIGAVALSGVLQVTGVLYGPLQTLLGTEPLGVSELLACAAVAVLPGAALRVVSRRT
jgi:Ca2+-transporting ATPase